MPEREYTSPFSLRLEGCASPVTAMVAIGALIAHANQLKITCFANINGREVHAYPGSTAEQYRAEYEAEMDMCFGVPERAIRKREKDQCPG